MAKIFKISGYLVDTWYDADAEDVRFYIEENNIDLMAHHIKVEEADITEWSDNNPLNYNNCPVEECEKYFVKRGKMSK